MTRPWPTGSLAAAPHLSKLYSFSHSSNMKLISIFTIEDFCFFTTSALNLRLLNVLNFFPPHNSNSNSAFPFQYHQPSFLFLSNLPSLASSVSYHSHGRISFPYLVLSTLPRLSFLHPFHFSFSSLFFFSPAAAPCYCQH